MSQSKIEELVLAILPGEMERVERESAQKGLGERALPSSYTVAQLLKSFSGYNKWMGEAAKGGTIAKFTAQLEDLIDVPRKNAVAYADNSATKSMLLYQRGRRHAFERDFLKAVKDFDEAYDLAEDLGGVGEKDHEEIKKEIVKAIGTATYARLLEWAGMCRHLRYDLKGASECYERCSDMEPDNVSLFQGCIYFLNVHLLTYVTLISSLSL